MANVYPDGVYLLASKENNYSRTKDVNLIQFKITIYQQRIVPYKKKHMKFLD